MATARAGNVIGGGDWAQDRLLPDLVRARESGAPVVLRHPDAVRPWQHVLDPLAGYLRLAERLAGSAEFAGAWNFGPAGERARPVRWVVDRVRERWPVDVRVEPPGDAVEAPALRLDASAAREQLGWVPAHDLVSGLDATLDWHDEYAPEPTRAPSLCGRSPPQAEDAEQERREEDLDARRSRASPRAPRAAPRTAAPKPRSIQMPTITRRDHEPDEQRSTPPSSSPCSSRKRARMRSNHGSFSPMKYVP